jgi:hypothetical protein
VKRHHLTLVTVTGLLLLAGCARGGDGSGPAARETTEPPHGYVEGAGETAEQQSRLVVADEASGAVRVIDLITEEVTELGTVDDVEAIGGDGRFAYLTGGDGSTHVIDGGSWTVDHGDHVHYYSAETRAVGSLDGGLPVSVHGDVAVTAVNRADGTVSLLDREALEAGTVPETRTVDAEGPAVPYAGHLVTPRAVLARDGERVTAIGEPCPRPRGEAVTSHGVVFGCADGALLVTEDEAGPTTFAATKIPYPEGTGAGERAREFTQRPGSGTLAAPAGDRGVWTLDAAAESWTLTETGPAPVAAANAVGDGATLLTLTGDGVLHAFDTTTGEETARTELPDTGEGAAIQLDTSRAYVNSPSSGVIYEIDYNDELRIARTLTLDITPTLMLETGR